MLRGQKTRLGFTFIGFISIKGEDKAKEFLKILSKFNLYPLKYDKFERTKYIYSENEFLRFWQNNEDLNGFGDVFIKGDGFYVMVSWNNNSRFTIHLSINIKMLKDTVAIISLGNIIFAWLNACFGYVGSEYNSYCIRGINYINERLPGLAWANFFSYPYVKMWGEEKVLNAPAYKIEKIANNGYLIVVSDSPVKDFDMNLELQYNLKEYFGRNYFARESYVDEFGHRTNEYYDYIAPF